jgi:hypothetical protein
MPVLNVREMGNMGVISDIAPWDLPASALTDGMNFRASNGKIITCGGLKDSSGGAMGHVWGLIDQSTDFDQNSLWVLMGNDAVKVFDGTSTRDIDANLTFPGPLTKPERWSSCHIGAMTVMNHPGWFPLYWEDRDGAVEYAEMLPWSPGKLWEDVNYSTHCIRAHKNFLFALGMDEGGDVFHDKVRWSHPAEPNGIPYTWETPDVDPSSIAGYLSLGRGGRIVGGESLRDSFMIYSDEAVNVLDYVGDAFGWRRRTLSGEVGLIGKEALKEINGKHFFISHDDILVSDGNSVESLLHNKLRNRLANTINADARKNSWVAHNQTYSEVWFGIPEEESPFPNIAYVFNYRDGTWALRDLEKPMRHAKFGNQPTTFDYRAWTDYTETDWPKGQASWHLAGNQPFNGTLFGVSDETIYNLDPQLPDEPPTSFIQRTDMPIGGHEANTTITRVYPLIEGSSEVEVRFGSQQYAGGQVRWAGGWKTFRPSVDRKIDIRTTGELHAYEIRAKGTGFFKLTGMDVEFSMAGAR